MAAIHRLGPNRGAAIDAGANEGLFTYRLAGLYERVHAFEINPVMAERLKEEVSPRVCVYPVGLSSQERTGTLFVPFYRGRLLTGWASLDPGNCPNAERNTELLVEVRPLDAYNLDGITFLKADVEGHELDLLIGARETIRRNRPVVLLEIKAKNLVPVRNFFSDLGYAERCLQDLAGVAGSEENYIFMPE